MKYFYTDPDAARWMGIKYGMIFITQETDEYAEETYIGDNVDQAFTCDGQDKVYVHPQSLYLLEPQIRDLALCEIDDFMHPEAEFQIVTYDPKLFDARHGIVRILYRNGMAFHWPESEAA